MNTSDCTLFLRLLYGDKAPGHLVLWTRQDKQAYWLPANRLDAVHSLAEQLASTYDVYFGVALQDKKAAFAQWRANNAGNSGEPTTRGYSETAEALPGLWLDIDVQGLAHKAANLPPTKAAALGLIREFPLAPTGAVDSGHGLQPWWLFRELWVFKNENERQQAQILARRFLATMQDRARAHGWMIDSTSDLARVLRVPGTWNRKLRPVSVRVIERNEIRYNPSDFEPYLVETPHAEDVTTRHWHGPAGALAPVLKHCRFLQHCRDNESRSVSQSGGRW